MDDKHEFSGPWDDSDLILIVEEQKLHVHRFILKMASPVFKAMLSSDFKEKNENELPLPRKKANEIVDLLRQIYPQFESKFTLQNIEYIYRLADEYQMKGVADACRQFLKLTKKTSENAMEMLVLAQLCDTVEVRKQCYEELEHFTVAQLKLFKGFTDMDERSLRSILLSKAEKLEKCLEKVLPQFCGLMDCVLYSSSSPNRCPVHYSNNITNTMMKTRIHCDTCKVMFTQIAKTSFSDENQHKRPQHVSTSGYSFSSTATPAFGSVPMPAMRPKEQQLPGPYYSKGGMYFDENLVSILQEMFDLLKLEDKENIQV